MAPHCVKEDREPIAIVGYAYRAPGVGRKQLWEYLAEAKSAFSAVPPDRFQHEAYHHGNPEKAGCISSNGGHFLPRDIYAFDAPFFNMTADEAISIDPQHRMLLECAFEAAESAGWTLAELAGSKTGVFAASEKSEYGQNLAEDLPTITKHTATGTASCMFANRLSYFFDLHGPSISVDAACSSSTYALHLACQSIRIGDCKSAFVGGSSLIVNPNMWVLLDTMGALSPDGKSYSYDRKANGFGRGEGGACLVLKTLSDALDCGDPIRAVIRNTSSNHCGRTNGISAPSQKAQEGLLVQLHEDVGLRPEDTAFVEGHGTGTQVGDPIDANAISNVLAKSRSANNPVYIGSLKSNFGHLEGASGVLSVVKAVMMIERRALLPNAWFEELNPGIMDRQRIKVPQTVTPLSAASPVRVCVTNFGFGGSNAAALLEDFQSQGLDHGATGQLCIENNDSTEAFGDASLTDGSSDSNDVQADALPLRLFVFSARCEASLTASVASFGKYLQGCAQEPYLTRDISYTLGQRRSHFSDRLATPARSLRSLQERVADPGLCRRGRARSHNIAFVFTGQGAQYHRMGIELSRYEIFAQTLREAAAHISKFGAAWSLTDELAKPRSETRISDPEISQPACTAIQIGLVRLLEHWGIKPQAVTGHSSGEIAASYAAGFITFKSAMAISFFRGQAATEVCKKAFGQGGMLALGVGPVEAAELIQSALQPGDVTAVIAAVNGPKSVTVSGDRIAIEAVERVASNKGIFARTLKVNVAYHSPHMEPVADKYLADIKAHSSMLCASNVACVSSVTGRRHYAEDSTCEYWVQNLVQPVQFSAAIEKLVTTPCADGSVPDVLVEIGPHGALKNPIDQTLQKFASQTPASLPRVEYLPSLVRGTSADHALLDLVGRLYTLGSPVDLGKVNQTHHESASIVTDLPSYHWNKASRYQHQSAVSTQKAHPGHAYNTLTGWKRPSSTASEHVFRQVFTLDEMPWIRDHVIAGEVLFPFTGYLSIVIAAVKALSPGDTPLNVVSAHDLHIKRGLRIQEEERVDLTTTFRPAEIGKETTSPNVWNFEIVSWSVANSWTVHCTGKIESSANMLSGESPVLRSLSRDLSHPDLREADTQGEYELLDRTGVVYGPEFRTMQKLWYTPGLVVHETQLRDLGQPIQSQSPVSTDAPTLDSFLHSIGIIQGSPMSRRVSVPTYFQKIKVSNRINAGKGQRFSIATRLESLDLKTGTMRVKVGVFLMPSGGDKEDLTPIVEIESFTLKSMTEPDVEKELAELPRSYFERVVPCLDFVGQEEMVRLVGEEPFYQQAVRHRQVLNDVGAYFMVSALASLAASDKARLPPHLSSFVQWAESLAADASTQATVQSLNAPAVVEEVRATDAKGEMLVALGKQLSRILRLEVEPLEIMLKDDLLSRNYEEDSSAMRCNAALGRFVSRLADSDPNLRILEIGAGTGSATFGILEAISREGQDIPSFREYIFTDISSGFFENARKKLSRWSDWLHYEKLDISKDPVSQGFVADTYDLVVASNVLHATSNMTETIHNVEKLLKPGGKLLLMENVAHQTCNMPYGLLPGWWLAQDDYRGGQGPLLSKDSWHRLLSTNGFSGVEGQIDDFPGEEVHLMTAMWSTKLQRAALDNDGKVSKQITIAGQLADNESIEFAEALVEQVDESLGSALLCAQPSEVHTAESPICVFVDSPTASIFRDLGENGFTNIQKLLTEVHSLIWVVPEDAPPEAYMIKGLLRTLRLEDTSRNLLLIEKVPRSSAGAAIVVQLAERLTRSHQEAVIWSDQDFVWHDRMICVPRLTLSKAGKHTFASEAGLVMKEEQQIFQNENEAFGMTIDMAGSPDSIYFHRTDALHQDALGDDEVIIRVEAVGVNFRDLLLVLGSMPWSGPGLEGAGVIRSVGAAVTNLRPGDRVCYISSANGYANYLRLPATSLCKIPDDLSTIDAATLPIAYSTALVCFERANLQRGDTVLIHAASGAVGLACIAMAKHMGASQIFVTCGSEEKKSFLRHSSGISQKCIFSSRSASFKDDILSATHGRGVDVVINSLSGDLLQESFALVADFGRFIEIGRKDFLLNNHLGMRPFDRNITFSGVDLYKLFTQKPRVLKECLCKIMRLFEGENSSVGPIRPLTVMSVSQIASALRKLQSGQNMGKIVITMDRDAVVLAEVASGLKESTTSGGKLLSSDATYLITGGTGGIGRALAGWMVQNGARNVVLLGRSGATNPDVAKLLAQYDSGVEGVRMRAIACDVGSAQSLNQALSAISGLPRVRGVVHGRHVCQCHVSGLAAITAPKLQGAWNLHLMLPKDLDFFVSLASIDGSIGHVGQSIYAGTSTFLDEFSRYRNKLGLPAVSIGLPVVGGIGYVADRDIGQALKQSIGLTLAETHVYTTVKGAIVGPSSGLNTDGRSLAVTVSPISSDTGSLLPWERFNPLAALRSSPVTDRIGSGGKQSWNKATSLLVEIQASSAPLEGLENALMDKVSVMTMINREDVRTDRSLVEYGLDSLVSVELRNWIRREFGAELGLTAIVGAEDLRALAEKILSHMSVKE